MMPDKTVMLVDGDRVILDEASTGLENAGFRVHGFSNPIVALQHVEGGCRRCDVVISEIQMPGMSGFQLVRRVKDLRPDIKVVLMTAFEKSELDPVFVPPRVDKIVRKPFTIPELVQTITDFYRTDPAEKS